MLVLTISVLDPSRIEGMLSVDVTHSTTVVSGSEFVSPGRGAGGAGSGGGFESQPRMTYPLRTDITVELRLWTKGGTSASSGAAKGRAGGKTNEEIKIELPDLEPFVPPEWH